MTDHVSSNMPVHLLILFVLGLYNGLMTKSYVLGMSLMKCISLMVVVQVTIIVLLLTQARVGGGLQ